MFSIEVSVLSLTCNANPVYRLTAIGLYDCCSGWYALAFEVTMLFGLQSVFVSVSENVLIC